MIILYGILTVVRACFERQAILSRVRGTLEIHKQWTLRYLLWFLQKYSSKQEILLCLFVKMFKIFVKVKVPKKIVSLMELLIFLVIQYYKNGQLLFPFIPQLDASELDSEVVHIVKAQLSKLFKYHKVIVKTYILS